MVLWKSTSDSTPDSLPVATSQAAELQRAFSAMAAEVLSEPNSAMFFQYLGWVQGFFNLQNNQNLRWFRKKNLAIFLECELQ